MQQIETRATDSRKRHVAPENKSPSTCGRCRGGEGRAVKRSEDAAGLLQAGDRSERDGPTAIAIEVGGDRQGQRHQAASPESLQDAAHNQPGQPGKGPQSGGRGDHGSDSECSQARNVDGSAPADIGVGAQQRHRDDVPAEESGHERRRLLDTVDGQADVRDHRRQQGDHDVGVHRGDEEPRAGKPEQQRAVAACRGRCRRCLRGRPRNARHRGAAGQ